MRTSDWLKASLKSPFGWLAIAVHVPMVVLAFSSPRAASEVVSTLWWDTVFAFVVVGVKLVAIQCVTPPLLRPSANDVFGHVVVAGFVLACGFMVVLALHAVAAEMRMEKDYARRPEFFRDMLISPAIVQGAAALAVSHLIELVFGFFWRGKYRHVSTESVRNAYWARAGTILLLNFGGAIFLVALPGALVTLIVGIKVGFELRAIGKRRLAAIAPTSAVTPEPPGAPIELAGEKK